MQTNPGKGMKHAQFADLEMQSLIFAGLSAFCKGGLGGIKQYLKFSQAQHPSKQKTKKTNQTQNQPQQTNTLPSPPKKNLTKTQSQNKTKKEQSMFQEQ